MTFKLSELQKKFSSELKMGNIRVLVERDNRLLLKVVTVNSKVYKIAVTIRLVLVG